PRGVGYGNGAGRMTNQASGEGSEREARATPNKLLASAASEASEAQVGPAIAATGSRSNRWSKLPGLAWHESRTARRRLLLYMSSIALGVGALVAIDSFSDNVIRSVHEQSKALLGGDVMSNRQAARTPAIDSLLDSLSSKGIPSARATNFSSMALVPRTGGTRLVQVHAVSAGYPFYGQIITAPAAAWA